MTEFFPCTTAVDHFLRSFDRICLIILVLNAMVLAFSPTSVASTFTAASCSRSDVGAAVSKASYGDTVIVPPGACNWSSNLTITRGMTLVGAGSSQTIIQSGGIGSFMLIYNPDSTSVTTDAIFDVSGLTFDMANTGDAGIWVNNTVASPIDRVLIHDNVFKNMNAGNKSIDPACLRIGENGDVYGVAYSNSFIDCKIVGENYGNYQRSWDDTTFSYGGANNFYWEDNTMIGNDTFHYSGHGGRYATRFNNYNFTDTPTSTWEVVWDMHGNQPSGVYGTMGCEHYNNTVTLARGTTVVDDRGGECMIFKNTVTGSTGSWQVREEYDDSIDPSTNSESQHVSNSYYFLNSFNGINQTIGLLSDCCNVLFSDQEFWNYSTSFNGSSGVGAGTLAARPSTCTAGVGYWVTNEGSWNTKLPPNTSGQFYRCTAGNTWTLYYTPYTYPHPLRGGGSVAPPTNLKAVVY